LRPVAAERCFQSHLFHRLQVTRQTAQATFGLLYILPGDVTADVFDLFKQALALSKVQGLQARQTFLFLLNAGGIVATVKGNALRGKFKDGLAGLIQEVTIMRNDHAFPMAEVVVCHA
jgi:hypothetical protein